MLLLVKREIKEIKHKNKAFKGTQTDKIIDCADRSISLTGKLELGLEGNGKWEANAYQYFYTQKDEDQLWWVPDQAYVLGSHLEL